MPVEAAVVLAFLATCGMVLVVCEYWWLPRLLMRERLAQLAAASRAVIEEPGTDGAVDAMRAEMEAAAARAQRDTLPTVTRLLSQMAIGKTLRLEMIRAGVSLRPGEFVALCAGAAVGLGVIGMSLTRQPLTALVMGVIGLAVPVMLLKQRQQSRRRRFDAQLTDALTLIASSLRSGYSFMRAMQMVADEMPAPICEEFAWALGEATLGVPVEHALERMVERVQSYDLDLVVTAVSIQLQVGGNLAEILDTISNTIRERVRVQGEIDGLTAEGKLSAYVLCALPPAMALFLDLRQPNYFQPLLNTAMGLDMIAGAVIGQIIGGLIIRKMITLDV
jgi:tight adherence protein B